MKDKKQSREHNKHKPVETQKKKPQQKQHMGVEESSKKN